MDSYLSEVDEMVTCTGCYCGVMTAYFVTRRDDAELSQPGDALCDACSYALRFKRYLRETEPPDDTPATYARRLQQQR
eukprot:15445856-Alexandrium_andersonii.AAC.1